MQGREMTRASLQRPGAPGYRLQGENPATAPLEQARRWVDTYDELIKFKRQLIGLSHEYAERAQPEVARAIRETDVVLLETQASRFELRRDFWQIRVAGMNGGRRRGPD